MYSDKQNPTDLHQRNTRVKVAPLRERKWIMMETWKCRIEWIATEGKYMGE